MTTHQHRIGRALSALAVALVAIGALVAGGSAASSATSSGPAAASTSSAPASSSAASSSVVSVPSPTTSTNTSLCALLSSVCPIPIDYYAPLVDTFNPPDVTLCQQPYGEQDVGHRLCHIDLRGLLYLPHKRTVSNSAKNQPLVVFVHGSTNNNGAPDLTAMATYFTKHGFAFFALHRRGHGDSTGQNLDGVSDDPNCQTDTDCDIGKIHNLCHQVFEVRQAIAKMKNLYNASRQPIIDPTKIALMGHSLGGIVTLCANTFNLGLRTVVDIAGASENWKAYDTADGGDADNDSQPIELLEQFVANHVTPPMFLQPMNDCSTKPTEFFGKTVADQNEPYEATLFPDVTVNTTLPDGGPFPTSQCKTAHADFVLKAHWVDTWGPSVEAWIDRWFVDPSVINTTQPTS